VVMVSRVFWRVLRVAAAVGLRRRGHYEDP